MDDSVPQVPTSSGTYHINVCGLVTEPSCENSAVCRVSGSGPEKMVSSYGISKVMTMDFKHDNEGILMEYGEGDTCSPSESLDQNYRLICKPRFESKGLHFHCSDKRWRGLRVSLHIHEEVVQRVH